MNSYKTKPARQTIDRIILYTRSMARYGKSPYIYPLYGLGELPQAFARLSAIYGGTYMLDKKISSVNVDDNGVFTGVTSDGETVRAKQVIGDPSYFGAGKDLQEGEGGGGGKMRVVETAKVVRAICLMKHPIPGTDGADSCQIIIPQAQVGRKNGMSIRSLIADRAVWRIVWGVEVGGGVKRGKGGSMGPMADTFCIDACPARDDTLQSFVDQPRLIRVSPKRRSYSIQVMRGL
jgi:Rab GDP dissociation inhibitor